MDSKNDKKNQKSVVVEVHDAYISTSSDNIVLKIDSPSEATISKIEGDKIVDSKKHKAEAGTLSTAVSADIINIIPPSWGVTQKDEIKKTINYNIVNIGKYINTVAKKRIKKYSKRLVLKSNYLFLKSVIK